MKKLNLVFGADNLQLPLTGIGRYSFELARRIEADPRIASMRYFSMGRWVENPLAALVKPITNGQTEGGGLRNFLTKRQWAIKAYNLASPAWFSWRLRGLMSSDVFHSPNFFVPKCKARKVVTVHDLSHELSASFHPAARIALMNEALPKSLAIADHVITVSETVRREVIQRFGLAPSTVTATLLAADPSYRPMTAEALQPALSGLGLYAKGYSLFVGTIEPRKNVERLIQAYELLPEDMRCEWPLVVAGGKGWNSETIHARMAKAQTEGWLRYMSFVDQRWLPALYAGARLVAYPSLYEGFGLPIVEAMASGTPVLTSNTSCMPEVAGGAARLVNPVDIEEIAQALTECLSNEEWQAEARAKGLIRAAGLSWDRCVEETIAVYKQLS